MKTIISKGNSKIGKIPNVSMTPCKSCPKDAPCKKTCYAMKSYRTFLCVRKAWDNNLKLAKADQEKYFAYVRDYLFMQKPEYFRWHIAGDILDQDYLDNMVSIAKCNPETKFLAFTKMHNLNYTKAKRVKNLSVVFSMWSGGYGNTRKQMPRAWMQDGTETRIPDNAVECPGLCENCMACWGLAKKGIDVIFNAH